MQHPTVSTIPNISAYAQPRDPVAQHHSNLISPIAQNTLASLPSQPPQQSSTPIIIKSSIAKARANTTAESNAEDYTYKIIKTKLVSPLFSILHGEVRKFIRVSLKINSILSCFLEGGPRAPIGIFMEDFFLQKFSNVFNTYDYIIFNKNSNEIDFSLIKKIENIGKLQIKKRILQIPCSTVFLFLENGFQYYISHVCQSVDKLKSKSNFNYSLNVLNNIAKEHGENINPIITKNIEIISKFFSDRLDETSTQNYPVITPPLPLSSITPLPPLPEPSRISFEQRTPLNLPPTSGIPNYMPSKNISTSMTVLPKIIARDENTISTPSISAPPTNLNQNHQEIQFSELDLIFNTSPSEYSVLLSLTGVKAVIPKSLELNRHLSVFSLYCQKGWKSVKSDLGSLFLFKTISYNYFSYINQMKSLGYNIQNKNLHPCNFFIFFKDGYKIKKSIIRNITNFIMKKKKFKDRADFLIQDFYHKTLADIQNINYKFLNFKIHGDEISPTIINNLKEISDYLHALISEGTSKMQKNIFLEAGIEEGHQKRKHQVEEKDPKEKEDFLRNDKDSEKTEGPKNKRSKITHE